MPCSLSFLLCDGCGEVYQETDDFIICECGRIAVRMEWATKEETAMHLLKRLHAAIGNRMMADEPTDEERIENLAAWTLAGKFISENADVLAPPPQRLDSKKDVPGG